MRRRRGSGGARRRFAVGEAGVRDPAAISRQPWDLIVEFDPKTDTTGAYSKRPLDRDHRLATFEQEPSFSAHATVWLAADGIEGGRQGPADLRSWRRQCLRGIRRTFEAFSTFSARPVVVFTAGTLGGKGRATLDALLDSSTSRAELVAIDTGGAVDLADYAPEVLAADPCAVLQALPDRTAPAETARSCTIPGRIGDDFVPVPVGDADLAWISKSGNSFTPRLAARRTARRLSARGSIGERPSAGWSLISRLTYRVRSLVR